ncbi:MAG: hypothetical protein RQ826_08100 [Xanthomonadales bacterium]|nr:hypothetical protein [Xanthomonadales bacterium]
MLKLLDILRLRAGPQDLPAGWSLAIAMSLAYLGQGLIAARTLGETDAVPRSLLAIAVQVVAVAALLQLKRHSERLPQTITALTGTGFILGLISVFLLQQADPEQPQPGLALVYLALFIWSLTVDAHIYRHALSITMSRGALIAVLVFAANFVLFKAVFG